jgi:hypothetical protein
MVIVGLILLIVGVVVLMDMGLSSSGVTDVHLLGWHLGSMGPGRILLLGAAIGVVLTLGLVSVLSGQRRARRHRRDRDRTIAGTRAENKRLAAQLDEQSKATDAAAAGEADQDQPRGRMVETGDVDAYPSETRRTGADYVLGAKYPQETTAVHTPPAPPNAND